MLEVAENVYRLGSEHHNFYVVADGGKATVIDAGCSKELPKLEAGLATIGLAPADVEAIVLTHAHADHIGFAAEAEATGTEIRASEPEAPIAKGDVEGHAIKPNEMPLWKHGTWKFLVGLMRSGILKAPNVSSVVTFADGEVLDLPGKPRAVYTPGHTVGHSAFYLATPKILFSGDALATRNLLESRDAEPQMMPDKFHTDPAQAKESLNVLAALDTTMILPGHGSPYKGQAAQAVETALA